MSTSKGQYDGRVGRYRDPVTGRYVLDDGGSKIRRPRTIGGGKLLFREVVLIGLPIVGFIGLLYYLFFHRTL